MRLLNYTNRDLLFVHKENLTLRGNHRYEVASFDELSKRDFIPCEAYPLRVYYRSETVSISFGIPVITEVMTGADPLPDGDDILIVSKQYAEACRRLCRPTDRLRLVCGGVYTQSAPFPIASTGMALVEACLPYSAPDMFAGETEVQAAIAYIRQARLQNQTVPLTEFKVKDTVDLNEYPLLPDDCFPATSNY